MSSPSNFIASGKQSLILPPRKRIFEKAFCGDVTLSTGCSGNGKNSKRVCDAQVQCNVGNVKPNVLRQFKSAKTPNGFKLNANYLKDSRKPMKSLIDCKSLLKKQTSKKSQMDSHTFDETLNPMASSLFTPKKDFTSSTIFSSETFKGSQQNSVAAAVAATYLYCSSLEEKVESVSITNDRIRSINFSKSPNAANTVLKKHKGSTDEKPKEKPLDLSVKKEKFFSAKESSTKKVLTPGNDPVVAWNQSLNLFYQVGQHYGNSILPTYQNVIKNRNHSVDITDLCNPTKNTEWRQKVLKLCRLSSQNHPSSATSNTKNPLTEPHDINSHERLSPSNAISTAKNKKRSQGFSPLQFKDMHTCQYYPESFNPSSVFPRHERSFVCGFCEKLFSQSSDLDRHIKTVHTKVR